MIVELDTEEINLVTGGQYAVALSWQELDPASFLSEILQQELFTGAATVASG